MDKYELLPALHKEKWVCVKVYYNDFEHMLSNVATKLCKEILDEEIASKYIYFRYGDVGETFMLTFKTSQYKNDLHLKEKTYNAFKKYFDSYPKSIEKEVVLPDNHPYFLYSDLNMDIEDNYYHYIFAVGGREILTGVAEDLLSVSSEIIINLIQEHGEEWSVEAAIEKQIALHLTFLHSFGIEKEEMVLFYEWLWKRMIANINLDGVPDMEDWKKVFIGGIENNFNTQRESFINYSEYLLEISKDNAFEEEWINSWIKTCIVANERISNSLKINSFIDGDNFVEEEGIEADKLRKWYIFECYLRTINNQLGISFIYEFNSLYAIKESLKHI